MKKLYECLELLKQGKKIRWDKNYVYPSAPTIKIVGESGMTDYIELDCIPEHKFEDYMVEVPTGTPETISVCSYTCGKSEKIKYVYANLQMNRTFACLESGSTVDYPLNIIDVFTAFKGEYMEDMEKIEITPSKGVCAKNITVEAKDWAIKSIKITGGCDGQAKVLDKLLRNVDIETAVKELKGITCGRRTTSCAEQLAIGLENWLESHPQPCPFNCDHCDSDKFDSCIQKFNR